MLLTLHPQNPQPRLVQRVVEKIQQGGVIVYPTDSGYALGCQIGNKQGVDRIRRIRQLDKHHKFTLLCRDLSEIATYAKVDNPAFRFLKANTPGPYTFILPATKAVPRMLQHPKRNTIGIRIPHNRVLLDILTLLDEPLMNVSLVLPDAAPPIIDSIYLQNELGNQVDLIVDSGPIPIEQTTIVDLTGGVPDVVRVGKGEVSGF